MVALVGGGGVFAYKYIFNRPGESAIALLPADSSIIVTLDTNPSDRQITVFRTIGDTLEKQHFAGNFDFVATKLMQDNPLAAKLRPYLTNNFAIGRWGAAAKMDHGAIIISVKDPNAVKEIVESNKKPKEVSMKVVRDYLVMSNLEADTQTVEDVAAGKKDSVATQSQFLEARKTLPQDANMMVFVSYDNLAKDQKSEFNFTTEGYVAFSATLEEEGLAFDAYGISKTKDKDMKALIDQVQPMDDTVLKSLPQRAYGALGFRGIDVSIKAVELTMGKSGEFSKAWDDGVKAVEKQSGLSVEDELLPALSGSCAIGVFPGASQKPEDLDVVVSLQNDDPALLVKVADKVRERIAKGDSGQNEGMTWGKGEMNGSVVWNLERPQTNVAHSSPLDDKTLVYAETSTGLTFGSSPYAVKQALLSAKGGENLASDPGYKLAWSRQFKDSNGTIVIHLSRIMDAIAPTLTKNAGSDAENVRDLLQLFGGENDAFIFTSKYENGVTKGKGFLPLDWEVAARMLSRGMTSVKQSMDRPTGRHSMDEMPEVEDDGTIVK